MPSEEAVTLADNPRAATATAWSTEQPAVMVVATPLDLRAQPHLRAPDVTSPTHRAPSNRVNLRQRYAMVEYASRGHCRNSSGSVTQKTALGTSAGAAFSAASLPACRRGSNAAGWCRRLAQNRQRKQSSISDNLILSASPPLRFLRGMNH